MHSSVLREAGDKIRNSEGGSSQGYNFRCTVNKIKSRMHENKLDLHSLLSVDF